MDTSTKQVPSEIEMGRPRDEALAAEKDADDIRQIVAAHIFEESRHPYTRDAADSFKAEAEFLHPLHIGLSESPDALIVRADVPGLDENDLKIDIQPGSATITGKRKRKKESIPAEALYPRTRTDRIMRVIDLPGAVTVNKVRILIGAGVLQLELSKAMPVKQEGTEAKAA